MNTEKEPIKAILFDFDGVVMNTEELYTEFWSAIGKRYLPDMNQFAMKIKGNTLTEIYKNYFDNEPELQQLITAELNSFEQAMPFHYIEGCHNWLQELKQQHIPTAIVTSSNNAKMAIALKAHPELKQLFDVILTANDFQRSKPYPDGYLTAAKHLNMEPKHCVVVEDSFSGMLSGKNAGMRVLGMATTQKAEDIAPRCDAHINNFTNFSLKELIQLLP